MNPYQECRWSETWQMIGQLWPEWNATDQQEKAWKQALGQQPHEIVGRAIHQHYSESGFRTPKLGKVLEITRVERTHTSEPSQKTREDAVWKEEADQYYEANMAKLGRMEPSVVSRAVSAMQEHPSYSFIAPEDDIPTNWNLNTVGFFVEWLKKFKEILKSEQEDFRREEHDQKIHN